MPVTKCDVIEKLRRYNLHIVVITGIAILVLLLSPHVPTIPSETYWNIIFPICFTITLIGISSQILHSNLDASNCNW